MRSRRLECGDPSRLGSACVAGGVNFAVYSERASSVELSLFDQADREILRVPLPGHTGHVWHGFLPESAAGLRYGFRAHGVFDPPNGLFFNPARVLVDPYARALSGSYVPHPSHHGAAALDNALYVPKSLVTADGAGLHTLPGRHGRSAGSVAPLIYEAHVRGLTQLCPNLPLPLRGTYAGLTHPRVLAHLKRLGVGVIELLPVQYHIDEPHLAPLGLTNYWGYNPLALMALHPGYASQPLQAQAELAAAVRAFHDAGIEVVLDVVFNHTAESGVDGPVLSMRGLDNHVYYRFEHGQFVNVTGCGNTLNVAHPVVERLVIDSLHHLAQTLDVDGFRFDLAVTLGRNGDRFSAQDGLLAKITADPVLSRLRLIAEPWDIGPDGYQLGAFAAPWREWNDRFRDTVRSYWRGDPGAQADLGRRLHGSSERFEHDGRTPAASVNFVSAHDGFVLEDLVSFAHKHNAANGEQNRDGHSHNLSDNMGHEGRTADPLLRQARERRKRAMLATLFLAQGTPMLLGGDEFGNSQQGNNNAYCQDNPLGWVHWDAGHALVDYIGRLSALRQSAESIWQDNFVHAAWTADSTDTVDADADAETPAASIAWLRADGVPMCDADWHAQDCPFILVRATGSRTELCCFNRSPESVTFVLPEAPQHWRVRLDSARPDGISVQRNAAGKVLVAPQSVVVLDSGNEA